MRKICFIALALLLSMAQSAWADTTGSWADYSDVSWGSDYSTTDDFTINTAAQMAKLAQMVNAGTDFDHKTVTLAADIDLGEHYWVPIGGLNNAFKGIFKGEGHTVSGMYINESRPYNGLFGSVDDDARIRNLKMTDSWINANSDFTGAIVGLADLCRIENCSVASSVTITSTAAQSGDGITPIATGGLVGKMTPSAALRGCVCGASVQGTEKVGGLVGEVDCATVVACIYTGSSVNGGSSSTQAAMFGNITTSGTGVEDYLPHNLYINSALDGKNGRDKRGYVISTSSGVTFDFGTPADTYDVSGILHYTYHNWPYTDYFMLVLDGTMYCTVNQRIQIDITAALGYVLTNVTTSAGTITKTGKSRYELYTAGVSSDILISASTQLSAWNGDGTGSAADPYLVKTPDDLRWIAAYIDAQTDDHYEGKFFQLANNIEFDGTANNFAPIGSSLSKYFAGTFDGSGHTISGINAVDDGAKGLFGYIVAATIKNLRLASSTFNSTNATSAGGIVAVVKDGATIQQSNVAESVTVSSGIAAGGIVGSVQNGDVTITGCTCGATISTRNSDSAVGGIVGQCSTSYSKNFYLSIAGCLYYGSSLTGSNERGGAIIGFYQTTYGTSLTIHSTISFADNYYTYPTSSIKAAGTWERTNGSIQETYKNFDIERQTATGLRVHAVTDNDDIADMEDVRSNISYDSDITYYDRGVAYLGTSYSHVLALVNNADNTDLIAQYEGQTFDVKLRGRRLYKDGDWNTICLPFDLTDFKGTVFQSTEDKQCTISELDVSRAFYLKQGETIDYSNPYHTGLTAGKIYLFFKDNDINFTAGKPFIVKWQKDADYNPTTAAYYDIFHPIFPNVCIKATAPAAVTSSDGVISFRAIYKPIVVEGEDRSILFVGGNNTLYYPLSGYVSMNAFRAYFQLEGGAVMAADPDTGDDDFIPSGGGNVKPFIISIEEDPTSLNEELRMKNEEFATAQEYYDLSGRKVSNHKMVNGKWSNGKMPKGIYIDKAGKKILY